jgi:hypothetical protein
MYASDGRKIGIIGYITPVTKDVSNSEDMIFLDEIEAVTKVQNHRGGKGRGETVRMSLPSQLERTPQLSTRGLLRVHLLLCPSKIFRHGNKNTLFLVMVYSALFSYVFKAFYLF